MPAFKFQFIISQPILGTVERASSFAMSHVAFAKPIEKKRKETNLTK